MNEKEFFESIAKVRAKDPEKAEAIFRAYKEDPTRTWEDLELLASKAPADVIARESKGTRLPLAEAYHLSEDQLRSFIDPNSRTNWMTMGSDQLLKGAIDAGYVRELTDKATPEEKQARREEFGRFLNYLAQASTDQGRRNAVAEYDRTSFTKEPVGWARKQLADMFARTYTKRAKEQALKGEGSSSYGEFLTSPGDVGTLAGDVAANSAFGAGGGAASRMLLARAAMPLKTTLNELGSLAAAGAVGGALNTLNRDINTDEGARGYEYVSEPLMDAGLNAIISGALARQALRAAGKGLKGVKIGGKKGAGLRQALNQAGEWADRIGNFDEARLANKFDEWEQQLEKNPLEQNLSPESRKKVQGMLDVMNDGLHEAPGEEASLFDQLQAMYERSGETWNVYTKTPEKLEGEGVFQDVKPGYRGVGSRVDITYAPGSNRFIANLDDYIADIRGQLATDASPETKKQLERKLKYFETAREMFSRGIVDPAEYLYKKNATPLELNSASKPFTPGESNTFVELENRIPAEDYALMKDYVMNAKNGNNLSITGAAGERLKELASKYPEFNEFVTRIDRQKGNAPSSAFLLSDALHGDRLNMDWDSYRNYRKQGTKFPATEGEYAYGFDFNPFSSKGREHSPAYDRYWGDKENRSKAILKTLLLDPAEPVARTGGVEKVVSSRDVPDTSWSTLNEQLEKLRAKKPEAVEAAIGWKFDPSLPADKQLNSTERLLVDRWRDAQRRHALGED
jgi:hypothetical protein